MDVNGLINDAESEVKLRNSTSFTYFQKTLMVFRYKNPKKCTYL